MLSLRQLRYFLAVCQHRHFGRAAEACNVSQPALSAQMQQFESILGGVLIERRRGDMALTPLGIEVEKRATRIIGEVGDLLDLTRPGATAAGALRFGVIPTIAPYVLPDCLRLLRERNPTLQLVLQESMTRTLIDDLKVGALDVALLGTVPDEPGLVAKVLFHDPFLLARSSQQSNRSGIEPILLLEAGHCLRDQASDYCRMADRAANHQYRAASLGTILQMVASGYGTTLLPAMAVASEIHDRLGVEVHDLPAPVPERPITLVWRHTSPRSAEFKTLGQAIIDSRRER